MSARPVMVAVQAIPGREDTTRATIEALHGHGGASTLPVPPVLCWTGPHPPPFDLPPGWSLSHWVQQPAGHRRELWRIMELTPPSCDLVLFEDDVIPCRNAVPYIAAWSEDCFTSFFNMRRLGPGRRLVDRQGFWGTQAVKLPGRLVSRMLAAGDTAPRGDHHGGDTRIGLLLQQWGEPIWYHRSLVQHVGAVSVHNPGATLTGLRAPAPDFDLHLDALTLKPEEDPMAGRKCPKCDKPNVITPVCPRCRFDIAAHEKKQKEKADAAAAAAGATSAAAAVLAAPTVPAGLVETMADLADAIREHTQVLRDAIAAGSGLADVPAPTPSAPPA